MAQTLFYDLFGFPLIVIVLLFGAVYFTIYFNFINVRAFGHNHFTILKINMIILMMMDR